MMLCVQPDGPDELLSLREVAELVGLARGTIRSYLYLQQLPPDHPRFRGADLFPRPVARRFGKAPAWWRSSIESWTRPRS